MANVNVRQLAGTVFSTAFSVGEEGWEEVVEKFWVALPAEQVRNPDSVFLVIVQALAACPTIIRKAVLHGLIAGVQNAPRIPEAVKAGFTVFAAPILTGTDAGLDRLIEENRIDQAALRAALMERWNNANPVTGERGIHRAGSGAAGAAGEAGTLARDGGRTVHLTGNTACDLAKATGPTATGWGAHGSIFNMLSIEGNRRCPVCFPEAAVRTTFVPPEAPAPAPAPTPTTLIGMFTSDPNGARARSFAALERIIQLRRGEVINRPTGVWRFMLLFRKGVNAYPALLQLLPAVTSEEYGDLLEIARKLEEARRGSLDRATWYAGSDADLETVYDMVDRYTAFMAQVRLIADQEVNDFREGFAVFLDAIDGMISDDERQRVIEFLSQGNVSAAWEVVKKYAGVVWEKAKWWWGVAKWALIGLTVFNFGTLLVGGPIYIVCFFTMTLFPSTAGRLGLIFLISGFGILFGSRIGLTLFDKVWDVIAGAWHAVRNGLRQNMVQQVVVKGFARVGIVIEQMPELPPHVPTVWWAQTGMVFSLVSLVGLAMSIVHVALPTKLGGLMILGIGCILAILAEMMKKWAYLLKFEDKEAMFKGSLKYVSFAAIGSIVLLIPTIVIAAAFEAFIGQDTMDQVVQWSHSTAYQEACEASGRCEPEHYRNSAAWRGYCDKYPQARECKSR